MSCVKDISCQDSPRLILNCSPVQGWHWTNLTPKKEISWFTTQLWYIKLSAMSYGLHLSPPPPQHTQTRGVNHTTCPFVGTQVNVSCRGNHKLVVGDSKRSANILPVLTCGNQNHDPLRLLAHYRQPSYLHHIHGYLFQYTFVLVGNIFEGSPSPLLKKFHEFIFTVQ